jgi:hypothetical protein
MSDKKAPNYTEAQETEMVERYEAAETDDERKGAVESIAEDFGKTVPSVRAKLVRLGVYRKAEYVGKTGAKPETKEAIVTEIATILGVDADSNLSGLEKATKNCLTLLRTTLAVAHQALYNESEENAS